MSTSDDAAKTVKDVVTTNHDKGAHDAGTKLHDDFVKYSQDHTADETRQYWDAVSKQLKDNGLLTTLAFDYAKDTKEIKNSGGVVTRDNTERELQHNKDMVRVGGDNVKGSAENQYRAMMQTELLDAFDKSGKGEKGYEWMHKAKSYLGTSTITEHLNAVENDRKTQVGKEQLRTPELMGALKSPDGKEPGDFWKTVAGQDGKVSQDELDNYIKTAKAQQVLPDKFDPANGDKTKYNAEWLKAAEQMKAQTEKLRNGDNTGLFGWGGSANNIDQESLAKGLGFKDAATMLGENKRQEAAPVADTNGGGNNNGDLASRSDAIVKSLGLLPDEQLKPFIEKGMTKDDANKLLEGDAKDHNLTVNQRDTLTKLRDDWDTVVGKDKPLDVKGLLEKDGKPSPATEHLKETAAKAQAGMAAINGADMSALVDDKGNITKDKVDAFLAKKPDGMSDEDYTKGKERAQFLKDNFNDISHDGTTISHDNMKQYAASMGASDKYQDYKDKPGEAAPPAADQATKDAQAKLDGLKQSDHLNSKEVPYDMAKRILEERSKVTGEATDSKAIMREVARLCITNGIGKPEVIANLQKKLEDPNYKITGKDLPKELNYVRYNQEMKIYSDAEKAKYVDMIKAKAGGTRPDNYNDTGETN